MRDEFSKWLDRRARERANEGPAHLWPLMVGSRNAANWAVDIRAEMIGRLDSTVQCDAPTFETESRMRLIRLAEMVRGWMLSHREAEFWITHRARSLQDWFALAIECDADINEFVAAGPDEPAV